MTRIEQETRIRAFFENNDYYSSYDILNSIQDGYDETVAFSGCIIKAQVLPFVAGLTYYDLITLLEDYIGVISIYNTVTNRWMVPTGEKKLDKLRPDWEVQPGTPELFYPVNHRYVAIYRKPIVAYGNMYIYYVASAPTLGASDAIQIPADYANTLEDYCITDLQEQAQEFSKATVRFQSYVDNLKQLQRWVKSNRQADRIPNLRG
jgi:hypothetical protein